MKKLGKSEKLSRRIDRVNYAACFHLVRTYYLWKGGLIKKLIDGRLIRSLLGRFFCLVVLVFRFNRYPYQIHYRHGIKGFVAQLLGFHNFKRADVPEKLPFYQSLVFPRYDSPIVTIVIVAHNQWKFTYACLKSILENTGNVAYSIIVVDDGSSDETVSGLQQCKNITLIRNDRRIGSLCSRNRAAAAIVSDYICFLGNNVVVQHRWLHQMIDVFATHANTGVVGGKLIYPYGLLEQAGGLVNIEGERRNFGRLMDARAYKYSYLRETDYVNSTCLLVEAKDFSVLNGFDEKYVATSSEDADLCFSVRYQLGKKVFYQPLAEVVCFNSAVSAGQPGNSGINNHQIHNTSAFIEEWKPFFNRFSDSYDFNDHVDKFQRGKKKILIIDATLPFYDKDSGSRRMHELIKIFFLLDLEVYFLPDYSEGEEPYYSELITQGVRIVYESQGPRSKIDLLEEVLSRMDYVWIARLHLNEKYASVVQQYEKVSWIYDTVDLHYLRMERSLAYHPSNSTSKSAIEELKQKELSYARGADMTLVVTPFERDILVEARAKNVKVIPNIHPVKEHIALPGFENRKGLCFIGGYKHPPNVDAVLWLVREIMPVIWERVPDMKLTLLGSDPPVEVLRLKSDRVEVPGFLHDVSSFFYNSRLFVAPLRYGAGMKGKIGQAMEYGLPVVSTDVGVEGMDLIADRDVVVVNNSGAFANAILELYHNKEQWNSIAEHSLITIQRYAPENVRKLVEEIFE
ncbi:glycosyltransferase [Niabella hirudinis]|uniref:glycosyltransferase n=1 Tax=Niabella hirudinis TaxID=1285929 RepID=UPI003EBE849C